MKNLFRKSICVAVSLLLLCSMTLSVLAAEYYIDDGSIQITDSHVNQEGKEAAAHDGNVTVTQRDPSTATSNTVTVKTESANVTVTLKDVNIDSASGAPVSADRGAGTTVTVELEGSNTLTSTGSNAALETSGDGSLVIQGQGALTADASQTSGSAGIGGGGMNNGTNITVAGGTVTAMGGSLGAGIGGGHSGEANNITITDGEVTAVGGIGAGAGIGGGKEGSADGITISGGTVIATGSATGIGGGWQANGSNITISGGTVNATGNDGAGIGGGQAENITISGGTVTAQGSRGGAGIGSGIGRTCDSITISGDAQVTATGSGAYSPFPGYVSETAAQAIGSGQDADASQVDISGLYTTGSVNGVNGTVEAPNDGVEAPSESVPAGQDIRKDYTVYSRGRLVTNTGAVKKVLFAFGEDWEETLEDGVLTITAPADAELKINVYAMNVLLGRNIDQIVFGGRTLALRDLVKGQTAKVEYVVSAGKLTLDGKEV